MRMLPILMASTVCLAVLAGGSFADPSRTTTRVAKTSSDKSTSTTTTSATRSKSSDDDRRPGTSTGGTGSSSGGTGSTSGGTGSSTGGTTTPVPPVQTATLNAAGEGRRLYLKLNCYGCHGMGAAGAMGPNIIRADAGDVSEAVLQGEGEGMPSYRNLVTATDLANLTAYLRSIGTTSEPKFNDWWVAVPTK